MNAARPWAIVWIAAVSIRISVPTCSTSSRWWSTSAAWRSHASARSRQPSASVAMLGGQLVERGHRHRDLRRHLARQQRGRVRDERRQPLDAPAPRRASARPATAVPGVGVRPDESLELVSDLRPPPGTAVGAAGDAPESGVRRPRPAATSAPARRRPRRRRPDRSKTSTEPRSARSWLAALAHARRCTPPSAATRSAKVATTAAADSSYAAHQSPAHAALPPIPRPCARPGDQRAVVPGRRVVGVEQRRGRLGVAAAVDVQPHRSCRHMSSLSVADSS